MKPRSSLVLPFVFLMSVFSFPSSEAKTPNIPAWYRLSAALAAPPRLQIPLEVKVTVSATVGELDKIVVSLLLPHEWTADAVSKTIPRLGARETKTMVFLVTPKSAVPNGSIVCSIKTRVPKSALEKSIRESFPAEAEGMVRTVKGWADEGEGFTDVPFALFPEEGFYPLGSDMWIDYDDRMKPKGFTKGTVYYRDALITPHQAQTDVEMYDKLQGLLRTDPKLAEAIKSSEIDLGKKRQDFLLGLYVLGTEAFLKGDFQLAVSLLERLGAELKDVRDGFLRDLALAGRNLEGLSWWGKGDRKMAEQTLKNAFYSDRKRPVQRYILRNLGLVTLDRGDKTTAREMFRLALDLKPSFSLLEEEYNFLKK